MFSQVIEASSASVSFHFDFMALYKSLLLLLLLL